MDQHLQELRRLALAGDPMALRRLEGAIRRLGPQTFAERFAIAEKRAAELITIEPGKDRMHPGYQGWLLLMGKFQIVHLLPERRTGGPPDELTRIAVEMRRRVAYEIACDGVNDDPMPSQSRDVRTSNFSLL